MDKQPNLPQTLREYSSPSIHRFLTNIQHRQCIYYVGDLFGLQASEAETIEQQVQRTMQVFRTLSIPTDEHFCPVFRNGSGFTFRDWKISELAFMYMLFNGDPSNLQTVARQQTELINSMLHLLHQRPLAV